ncbi:hypothetical protein A9K55_005537 [Cordyceps militaris]|uniref:Uncharacterized protein n=1 Tax=Cordyceps militaris TaxID=73501 RepID=A0A2H4SAH9_CORMI|nr:hypothetical protein A9K55_005537 [Cordyceps militaris]
MLHTKIPVFILALAGYGLSIADAHDTTHALTADEFLAKHPQIAVGRNALNNARQSMDDSLTFTAVTNPASNVILVQAFAEGADPEDLDAALYSVALVRDQKAQDFFAELQQQNPLRKMTSQLAIAKRASGCNPFCGTRRDWSRDWRCPSGYYVGGNYRWQKSW